MSAPFARRHIGPSAEDQAQMLRSLGVPSLESLIDEVVPADIRLAKPLKLPAALTEDQAHLKLAGMLSQNGVLRSFIGLGYHDTITPPVIQRNILENPGWYTAYTPYQAEISQGRLEALINYQTMICDLTGLDVSNASLLDEGTAAAEAMSLAIAQHPGAKRVLISQGVHAPTLDVVRTRMAPLGIEVEVFDESDWNPGEAKDIGAVLVQYPDTLGVISDHAKLAEKVHAAGALFVVAADLLSLTLLRPPGEFGADICVGNSQRFGVPLGFGGPHAAFMAVRDALKRRMPGRLIGTSIDSQGKPAHRLSLQTREQHIRREKATSNICTAQVLLAVMASMYAVYHGPEGLKRIAGKVHQQTCYLADELVAAGFNLVSDSFFDTIAVYVDDAGAVMEAALQFAINLGEPMEGVVLIALDERTSSDELMALLQVFDIRQPTRMPPSATTTELRPKPFTRTSSFLTHKVFHSYHSETDMMRYLHRLEVKDIALNRSMIALGSCTMKLNAAAEMMPLSWPEVSSMHPFVPSDQASGWLAMFKELEAWLAEISGFSAISLQPNAGSQGEYAGLLAIRRYHLSRGDAHRNVCLIPVSAHGTNPASAVMCGFKVVPVKCDEAGNIDVADLHTQLDTHRDNMAALMVTYPSTHGVFEEGIIDICKAVHAAGAQVYMDGANMNAQVGLTSPARIGADVCHLNLHKTFCIPHGGGGPGVGPIGVAKHLAPHLPGHGVFAKQQQGAVCSAPWGSASINVISWMYIAMMGPQGLTEATRVAILNANYIATRLSKCFPVLYKGRAGRVAHECILDFRDFKSVTVEDIAKRLIDFGFHAPTMSWPVAGTLMIEPTESESLPELNRFCEAMEQIHREIMAIESGTADAKDNVLKHAPHTAELLMRSEWSRSYSREAAAYPLPWVREDKYWPPVGRVDNVHGDRHLICTCISVEDAAR